MAEETNEDGPLSITEEEDAFINSQVVTHHNDAESVVSTLSRSTLVVHAIPMAQIMVPDGNMFMLCDNDADEEQNLPSTAPPTEQESSGSENSASQQKPTRRTRPLWKRHRTMCIFFFISVTAVVSLTLLVADRLQNLFCRWTQDGCTTRESQFGRAPTPTSLTPSLSPTLYPTLSPASPLQSETVFLDYRLERSYNGTQNNDNVELLTDTALQQWHTVLASGLVDHWDRRHRPEIVLDHLVATTTSATREHVQMAVTIHYFGQPGGTGDFWFVWINRAAHQVDVLRQLRFLNPEFHSVGDLELILPDDLYPVEDSAAITTRQLGWDHSGVSRLVGFSVPILIAFV